MTQPSIEAALTELVTPILTGLPREQHPAVIALAERIAAGRYRAWAEQASAPEAREVLLACAAREEDIAARVEAVTPGADAAQDAARASCPDLPERYAALFDGEPLAAQLARQAEAERVGAGVWRSLAAGSTEPTRGVYLACAALEEASADAVTDLIERGRVQAE